MAIGGEAQFKKVTEHLINDNKALRDLVDWQAEEINRLREALREVVEAWDWWQVDPHDRCSSVPSKAIDAARAALGEEKE